MIPAKLFTLNLLYRNNAWTPLHVRECSQVFRKGACTQTVECRDAKEILVCWSTCDFWNGFKRPLRNDYFWRRMICPSARVLEYHNAYNATIL
jgi:hypothetical protein